MSLVGLVGPLVLYASVLQPPTTVPRVAEEIYASGVREPDIVLRQSIAETKWYTCEHCSFESNNLFGFRWKGEYLEFPTWRASVVYYKKWQDKWYKGGDYYGFLRRIGYAESPTYIEHLRGVRVTKYVREHYFGDDWISP